MSGKETGPREGGAAPAGWAVSAAGPGPGWTSSVLELVPPARTRTESGAAANPESALSEARGAAWWPAQGSGHVPHGGQGRPRLLPAPV